MTAAKLIKLAPTLIMLGFLGYSLYSMESGIPEEIEKQAELQKGLDRLVHDMLSEGTTAAARLEGKLRDPFWVAVAPVAKVEAAQALAAAAEPDGLAEIIRGMTLDATFLQGRDQLAVIGGRIYGKGQRIALPGDGDRSVQVVSVTRVGVLLKGDEKLYHLGYPDQLGKKKEEDGGSEFAKERAMKEIDTAGQVEMFQKLLNSPLGAMGRGLIGNAAGGDAKARGRRAQAPRSRGSGAGGP